MYRLLRTIAFFLLSAALAGSQTAVVTRNVNLRSNPSTTQTPIAKLTPETQLQLLETGSTNGYLPVKLIDKSGWVWSKNVQTSQLTPATRTGGGEIASASAVVTAISSDWDKPDTVSSVGWVYNAFPGHESDAQP